MEYFYGVSIDELNEIAFYCRFRSYVVARGDELIYYFRFRRGHTVNKAFFHVYEGKLQCMKPGMIIYIGKSKIRKH